MARAAGAESSTTAIAPDDEERLAEALGRGLMADVLLITGGVSAGNRDLVPATLERLGVEKVFHKVRLKPGKPLWFGAGRARADRPGPLVFGLPGNPVSGVVGFLLFVRPALRLLAGGGSGSVADPAASELPLASPFAHRGDRPTYYPARLCLREGRRAIETLDWAGSADLRTVARSDGFAIFGEGERTYRQGEIVGFLPLG
jgi:molybdopterin molybdotransferase